MKKTLVLFMVLLFTAGLCAQDKPWFKGSFEEAKAKATKENKFIVIDVSSEN